MSNSLQTHGLQHSSLAYLSLSSGVCSCLCPLSRWCHLIISSSAAHFSFCLQSFPASESFPMSHFFASTWPKNYWRFGFSISSSNQYSGLISFRIDWFDRLTVQESSPAPQFESINSSAFSLFYDPIHTTIHDYLKNFNFY